jgi:hypothetical protein
LTAFGPHATNGASGNGVSGAPERRAMVRIAHLRIHFATNCLDKWIPDSRYAASGMTTDLPVVPICRRHFCLRRRANHRHFSAHPVPA